MICRGKRGFVVKMPQRYSRCLLTGGLMLVWLYTSSVSAAVEKIITDQELLQNVFPADSEISRQELPLSDDLRQRIERRFHFVPREEHVTMWLARDPDDRRLLGGVLKSDGEYQQRPVAITVAMSSEQRILRAAVVAIDPAIRPQFEATIGVGYITRYTMLALRQLSYLARVLAGRDPPSAWVSEQIYRQGAMLAVILAGQQAQSPD